MLTILFYNLHSYINWIIYAESKDNPILRSHYKKNNKNNFYTVCILILICKSYHQIETHKVQSAGSEFYHYS